MRLISQYTRRGMERAEYEKLEDGSYYGEIPELIGVYAAADSLAACQRELESVLEGWVLLGLKLGHAIPALDGIDLSEAPVIGELEPV